MSEFQRVDGGPKNGSDAGTDRMDPEVPAPHPRGGVPTTFKGLGDLGLSNELSSSLEMHKQPNASPMLKPATYHEVGFRFQQMRSVI